MTIDFSPITRGIIPSELFEQSTKSSLFICDDVVKGYSIFIPNTRGFGLDKTFMIQNPNHKELTLMRIDGVLFPGKSKCDCAIIYDSEFDFIELKTYSANASKESIENQYKKSYNQLRLTIGYFIDSYKATNKSFRDLFKIIQAYSVFNPTVPYDNASQKLLSAKFAREVKIRLNFINHKII